MEFWAACEMRISAWFESGSGVEIAAWLNDCFPSTVFITRALLFAPLAMLRAISTWMVRIGYDY